MSDMTVPPASTPSVPAATSGSTMDVADQDALQSEFDQLVSEDDSAPTIWQEFYKEGFMQWMRNQILNTHVEEI